MFVIPAVKSRKLQWGSETGSRRRPGDLRCLRGEAARFNGAPRLGLGEGWSGRQLGLSDARFNGAPRLGLGEGRGALPFRLPQRWLQWGSETGSRRRGCDNCRSPYRSGAASMGLRDWVSEKATIPTRRRIGWAWCFNGAPRLGLGEGAVYLAQAAVELSLLQWGSETGSRRRVAPGQRSLPRLPASMGLRDWVSEKA